jgi:hypothetical protein
MTKIGDILQRRDVQRYLSRKYTVVWAPLWLTGGTSSDGRIVYLDTNLRDRPKLTARVIYHERVEAAVRHLLGKRYPEAHYLATEAEREKYGPEDAILKRIVAENIRRRSRHLPQGFDPVLAKEAAQSEGT